MGATGVIVCVIRIGLPGCGLEMLGMCKIGRSRSAWYSIYYSLLRAIRIQCTDCMSTWVVEHPGFPTGLFDFRLGIVPTLGKERLVLFDDLALVVIDLPAADDDVRV